MWNPPTVGECVDRLRLGTGRQPQPLLAFRPARVLIDDFHYIGHSTADPPPRFVCLGAPLATSHVCVAERRLLLTYLLTLYVYTGRGPKRGPNMENSAYAFGEMHYLACVLWRRRPRPAQGTGTGPSGSVCVVARWRCGDRALL
jgi:hypothetical protein